jgi:hypothetical protein
MSIDLDGDKKVIRKSDRVSRPEVKTEERKTTRVRPGGSVHADRLAVPQAIREAYPDVVFFWENEEKGKPELRISRGWEIVRGDTVDGKWQPCEQNSNLGNVVRIPVGRGETTDNMSAVLMMLPRDWYEDDCREQEKHNQDLRNSLRRGSNSNEVNSDGTYAPRLPNGKYGYSEQLNATK